ncbi:MAG: amidophosphoribosyltransferase [Clostridiales bacterium]|nr:amidophosphoribosyltransferase [Clostridiales bacterium]
MIQEECGVMGAYDFDGKDVATDLYHGLYSIQHRGQESCGIVTNEYVRLNAVKGAGLVNEVFNKENLATLKGNIGVGHVRYGATDINEAVPPIVSRYCKGTMTLAMNGFIKNYDELRIELEQRGAIFQSSSHAEMIMNMIAVARTKTHSAEEAVLTAIKRLEGAYSIVVMSPRKLIAVRDPYGFRPLSVGKRGNRYFFSSETAAFDVIRAERLFDVKPGELIKIDDGGVTHFADAVGKIKPAPCIFEYVYFARPDSYLDDGTSVYRTRVAIGKELYKACPAEADMVVGVPDSGLHFALGYSYASGIPYGVGLVKNSYVGRTFIRDTDEIRYEAVSIKLNALRGAVEGKTIVLVDDSIVRGTTSANLIKLIKDGGAKAVHMRIASPPFLWRCKYGTDIPDREHLIAARMSCEEIRAHVGADSLGYLPVDAFDRAGVKVSEHCTACFTGKYPDEQ